MFYLIDYLLKNNDHESQDIATVCEDMACVETPVQELLYELKNVENALIAFHTQHLDYVVGTDAKDRILDSLKLQQSGIENLRQEIHDKEIYDLTTTYFIVREQEMNNFKILCKQIY